MANHTIRLEGEAAQGARISLRALRDITNILTDTAKRTLRLRLDGRSTLSSSSWLDAATDIELVGLQSGSTVIELSAPSISDALKGRHAQLSLWGETIPTSATAFDFVEDAMRDAIKGNQNSDYLDRNVLNSVFDFSRILGLGYEAFTLNGGPKVGHPLRVTLEELQKVEQMRVASPPPQAVIVSGLLDVMSISRKTFTLLVPNGGSLRGVFPDGNIQDFTRFMGQRVVVDGEAIFRPSGTVLNLRASHITKASDADKAFEAIPRPAPQSLQAMKPLYTSPAGTSGMDRVFGKWPGDETDAELLAALKEMDS